MANALKRDIAIGEIVAAKGLKPQFAADPRFRVRGGFGTSCSCSGGALFGTFLGDGEECRWEGRNIRELTATERAAFGYPLDGPIIEAVPA